MSRNRVSNRKEIRNSSWQFFFLYLLSLGLFGWALFSYVNLAPKKVEEVNLARLGSLKEYEARFANLNTEMDSVLRAVETLEKKRDFDYARGDINKQIRVVEDLAKETKYNPQSFKDLTHILMGEKEKNRKLEEELFEKKKDLKDCKDAHNKLDRKLELLNIKLQTGPSSE
jgi:RNA polymerase-interacting CarD/CdnL/TRCF family regulator